MRVLITLLLGFAIAFAEEVYSFQSSKLTFNWEDYSNEYLIRNYRVQDGLPVNSVNFALHHTDGFMYFATNDGLVRFDGKQFVNHTTRTHPQLLSNRIAVLERGLNNDLWFRDVNEGLYVLRDGEITNITNKLNISDLYVRDFESLKSGNSILATNKGNFIMNPNFEILPVKGEHSDADIFKITSTTEHSYFLASTGVYTFRNEKFELVINSSELKDNLENVRKPSIISDSYLWLPGQKGYLVKIDLLSGKVNTYKHPGNLKFWDMSEMENGNILLLSNRGHYLFDMELNVFEKYLSQNEEVVFHINSTFNHKNEKQFIASGSKVFFGEQEVLDTEREILNISQDREGSIWVSTNGNGVFQLSKKRMITISINEVEGLSNVYGLNESEGEIFVSSYQNGLFKFTNEGVENWNKSDLGGGFNLFRSVTKTKSEKLITGNFGLWIYQNNEWVRKRDLGLHTSERVDVIFEGIENEILLGTTRNLYLYKGDKAHVFRDTSGVELKGVRAIKSFGKDTLFIATAEQGVALIDSDNKFKFLNRTHGLSSDAVRDIYPKSKDTLWVATEDNGLNRVILNRGNGPVIESIGMEDGLIDFSLHRIIDDGLGFFWINSNSGVMRINIEVLNKYLDGLSRKVTVQSFGLNDGLINLEGNGGVQNAGLLTEDGKLLLPNQAGLIYTQPKWHIRKKEVNSVKPIMESVIIGDSVISSINNKTINIPFGIRDIQIKLTLPTFEKPDRLSLEYLLDDVNSDWQQVSGDRMAIFTNIPAGKHILKVRGSLFGDQKFYDNTFVITIPYFFYETVWFKILLGIFVIGLFIMSFRLSVRKYRDRESILNELVEKRTEQLLEEKERTEKALIQVQEIDRSKSQFFTNFTHELRTPLSLILGPLEDMIEAKDGTVKSNKDHLHLMKRNAVRLKDLVNQLLDVSKLSAGELALTFEAVDLLKLTRHIASQFEHSAKKKNISITVVSNGEIPKIYVDVSAWNHICMNLLSNALKYTKDGGKIDIEIETHVEHIEVSFRDTGTGISSEDVQHIFEAYYQGKNQLNKTGGTGIGLALTKGLVEQMSGIIDVESQKETGTNFTILLSKGKDHIRSTHEIINSETIDFEKESMLSVIEHDDLSEPATSSHLGEAKVLLVEDNDDFRNYLKSLINEKYDVEVAKNGLEGLNKMSHFKPDIVVSDIMMPKMNGFEMMKAIRRTPRFQHTPFIFLSAKDSDVDIETGLNFGADIYLTKPTNNKLLLTQIKVLLRREKKLKTALYSSEKQPLPPLVKSVQEIIYRHLGNPELNVELIAKAMIMSETSLYRKWKKHSKETLNKTITRLRFEEAIKLIKEESLSISEAAYAVGYNHLSSFSKAFKKMYGESPQEYLSKIEEHK
ncbi:MAG: response regulator [Balneola sp.]|jgi:signal transduction histidine kinase/DNA-binding response OmpR family regulator/ligand-binding sensor domain-containing protein